MTGDGGGRYADGSAVLVRFPRTPAERDGDRNVWPWLPGTVLERCGPDEWRARVDAPELEDGDGMYPAVYWDASELRPAPVSAFRCPCCGDDVFGTPPLCGGCRAAGCEQTTDSADDLGWSNCQREPGDGE